MITLTELDGKSWYRFLKILYRLAYLLSFLFLFLVLNNNGRDYHDPILPDSMQEAIKDPDFYKLSDLDMKNVLLSYQRELSEFSFDDNARNNNEIDSIIKNIKARPSPTIPLQKKYHYKPFHTWNINKCITYGIIVMLNYVLIIECIRRGIYYVLIGQLFPKE